MSDTQSVLSQGVLVAETYEVQRLLGRGGMGEVWVASHKRLPDKQVAIKVLHLGGPAAAETQKRFVREAQIASKLAHPNIVQVLDFATLPSGHPYLVMELLQGESLAARLKGGPLDLASAQHLVRQVGSALQAAHAIGVVHRDLKPENLFLVPSALGDQVKVLDFGISKAPDSGSLQTTDSVLIGTPLYMSPEQALGNNREVGPQSDIFALGTICYEALTGQAPFVAESIAKVVFRIAYAPHEPLAQVKPELAGPAAEAVERALTKDRAQRTKDIATFVEEFTGRPLPPVHMEAQGPHGVFTPGMAVSSSMVDGQTVAPGSMARPLVTPQPTGVPGRATPVPPPNGAALQSAKKPVPFGAVMGVIAVVVVVGSAAMVYLQQKVGLQSVAADAGTVARAEVPDAGPALVVDAGALTGVPVADAGAVAIAPLPDAGPRVGPREPAAGLHDAPNERITPEAQDALNRARLQFATGQMDAVWDGRNSLMNAATTSGGKREIWVLLFEIACARNDVKEAVGYHNRLSPWRSVQARADATCRKYMKDQEF